MLPDTNHPKEVIIPAAQNADARLVQRIDQCLHLVSGEDERKLVYIRSQLTPAGLERRADDEFDSGVLHLHQIANSILKGVTPCSTTESQQ